MGKEELEVVKDHTLSRVFAVEESKIIIIIKK